jgi:hypothetical protein
VLFIILITVKLQYSQTSLAQTDNARIPSSTNNRESVPKNNQQNFGIDTIFRRLIAIAGGIGGSIMTDHFSREREKL